MATVMDAEALCIYNARSLNLELWPVPVRNGRTPSKHRKWALFPLGGHLFRGERPALLLVPALIWCEVSLAHVPNERLTRPVPTVAGLSQLVVHRLQVLVRLLPVATQVGADTLCVELRQLRREVALQRDEVLVRVEDVVFSLVIRVILVTLHLLVLRCPPHRQLLVLVRVERIDIDRLHRALHAHAVELTALLLRLSRQAPEENLRHEQRHTVLSARRLEARRHVHVRAEVGGVDLLERADRPLNTPANMQAKAHVYLERLPIEVQVLPFPVAHHLLVSVQVGDHLDVADHGLVRDGTHRREAGHVDVRLTTGGGVGHAPCHQKRVSEVLVALTGPGVHLLVDDGGHVVDEVHDLHLEFVGEVVELVDVAEAERRVDELARRIDEVKRLVRIVGAVEVLFDDLRTSHAETDAEKRGDLLDGGLNELGLVVDVVVVGVVEHDLARRVLRHLLDEVHHRLDRFEHELVSVGAEGVGAEEEHDRHEDRGEYVVERVLLPLGLHAEDGQSAGAAGVVTEQEDVHLPWTELTDQLGVVVAHRVSVGGCGPRVVVLFPLRLHTGLRGLRHVVLVDDSVIHQRVVGQLERGGFSIADELIVRVHTQVHEALEVSLH
mmetsp:Transcript_16939/g.39622  ORF Transcript_16939/g.39622 Transcript_16939/m.39622 type:complete len:610 (-) Transcript_16939:1224-3053(-)